jgi:hypothetical protein
MQMKNRIYILAIFTVLMSSCAAIYNPIEPAYLSYELAGNYNGLKLSYRYGILAELNNKRYARKESKQKIKLVAVKIENTSNKALVIGSDFNLTSNGQAIEFIKSAEAYQKLKQKNWPALGFLLLALTPPVQTTNGASVADFPLGMVAGPMLAAGNIFVAINANKQFQSELQSNTILGSTIKPQETIYGIIVLNSDQENPIEIKF